MSSRGVRVTIIVSFAVLVLLGGSAVSRGQAPDDSVSRARPAPVSYPVAAGQPPGIVVTSSGVHEIPTGSIAITDLGALPANITVTVGAQVFWVNNTTRIIQISGPLYPNQIFLPMIGRPSLQSAEGGVPNIQPITANWISDPVAPDGQYGRVFAEAGVYPFYASHINGVAGVVTVVSDTLANTTWVEAEAGGTIAAGASTLEIPPGALAQDTAITVGEPISGTTMQTDGMMMVGLEPSGLTFSRPATLTLSYGDTGTFDEEFLQVVAFNEQTGEWEPQEILAQDEQQHTVSVKTEHFSWRLATTDEPLYVIMQIPGKFLDPGDILYALADGSMTWFPGHTAIYSDTVGASLSGDGEQQIMESNAWLPGNDRDCGPSISKLRRPGGVRPYTLNSFISDLNHVYMGAHTNSKATIEDKRNARDFAVRQQGAGFLLVGQGNLTNSCFACVGLVEASYDYADDLTTEDINIVRDWEELPFITPLLQFRRTKPVDEIHARVGEAIHISVYSVVLNDIAGIYGRRDVEQALNLPVSSTFSDGVFNWTPQVGDGGKDFTVQFQAQATVGGKQYDVTQSLTIHVLAANDPTPTPTPPPGLDTAEEILIPAGNFQMGCDSLNLAENCGLNEQPLHTVYLDAYTIDKYEVTNARYQACVEAGGCTAPRDVNSHTHSPYYGDPTYADYPVVKVTWYRADAFCKWAGKRLPTEAEWEKAARGNIDTRKYPWGNTAPTCATANFYDNVSGTGYCVGDTDRVGARPAGTSPYGVMNMAGNVWEWVNDWYDGGYYSVSPVANPQGPATGSYRVLRGGSWDNDDNDVRSARRGLSGPYLWIDFVGFRCVRSQ